MTATPTYLDHTHQYFLGTEEVPGVTHVLRDMGLDRDWHYTDPFYRRRGKAIHEACRLIDKDTLDWERLAPAIIGWPRAWEKFLRERSFEPDPEMTERPMLSDRYRFGGTCDRWGMMQGERWLIDIKTGDPIHPAVDLQLGLYAYLIEEVAGRKTDKRAAVRLREDGDYELIIPPRPLVCDVQLGLAAVQLYHLRKAHRLL
jgi:hypothetical protein